MRFATGFRLCLAAGLLIGSAEQFVSLLAQDAKKSTAATPAPKFDKDGKTPQAGFVKRHDGFVDIAKKGGVDVVFFGDSITDGWRGGGGKAVWDKNFEPLKAANFGIGGDRTQHVLWRIVNGEMDGIKPKVAVVMIGTNNSGSDPAAEIAEGVTEIVKLIRSKSSETKVLLLAVFPRGQKIPNPGTDKLTEVNKVLAKLDDGKNVRYLDIGPKFLDKEGQLPKDTMPDYLHLSGKGYEIWAEAMMPLLKEMLK
jgi:lysophospholipase L1-like esterase